jgi:hypothetical protein
MYAGNMFNGFDLTSASNYYYIDLFAIACMLGSIWLLGNQRRAGFVVGLLGATSFVIFGVLAESLFAILGNLLLAGIYIRGWLCWKPQKTLAAEFPWISMDQK